MKKPRLNYNIDKIFAVFPWVWLAAAYCITMLVLYLHGRSYIDSDIAGDVMLADLLNREGGLLAADWWYSSELRVVYLQLLYRLALLIFPQDWYAAQMLGQAGWLLLLILSYLYAAHGLELRNCGAWGAAALACPFGTWYLWYGPFGGAYLPHIILILLSFGAMLHLLRPACLLHRVLQWGLLFASAASSGLNGIKGLMGFYLPMVVAMIAAVVLRWYEEPQHWPRRTLHLFALSCMATVIAGVAYLIYSKVLAGLYSFEDYNGRVWADFDLSALFSQWGEFLSLFGYPTKSALKSAPRLLSVEGILGAFGVLTAVAIVFSLVRLLGRWKRLSPRQRIIPLLFASICLVDGMIFACTEDVAPIDARYWLTVVPFAFLVLQLEMETEQFRPDFMRQAAAFTFCLCITATSVSSVRLFFQNGRRINPHLQNVCNWLVEEGYTRGYATFWNGNVLTEWSSGALEMWVVSDLNTLDLSQGLQEMAHREAPKGEVFLLTTREELEIFGLSELENTAEVVYADQQEKAPSPLGHYLVMTFSDADTMQNAITAAHQDAG